MTKISIFAAAAVLASATTAYPAPPPAQCVKQSPPHAIALIELYTSEGCNSCLPADQWVSRLDRSGYNADQVVPLALHVDYWDRLGWKDRFASARFSERQRALATLSRSRVVYTPGVFLNLREFRSWDSPSQLRHAVQAVNAKPASADIRLELDPLAPAAAQLPVRASFKLKPGAPARQPQAFIALYESKLSTDVKAGENGGVTLHHDYVVREWIGPIDVDGTAQFKKTLALDREWITKHLGVAAFVQDFGNGEILQATALPVCTQ